MIAFILFAAGAFLEIPSEARQGETVRLSGKASQLTNAHAVWNGQSIPFFAQADGSHLALVPIAADLPPGARLLELTGAGGQVLQTGAITVIDSQFPIHDIRVGKSTKALRPLPGEMKAVAALKSLVTPRRLWSEPFGAPVPGCIRSVYGVARHHNGEPTGNYHKGVDHDSPRGRPVRAVTAGRVVMSRMWRLHGGTIGLDHGQGVSSIYIHLSRLGRKAGARVKQGDIIGYVGATGFATGPHLHWQLFIHGVPVNPEPWIPEMRRCE